MRRKVARWAMSMSLSGKAGSDGRDDAANGGVGAPYSVPGAAWAVILAFYGLKRRPPRGEYLIDQVRFDHPGLFDQDRFMV
jgi:hypothetical protein